jgi:hypothetical protein
MTLKQYSVCFARFVQVDSILMKNILTCLAAVLLFASCKKEVNELPASTTTGANTFGAFLDGEMWIPQQFGVITANNLLEARMTGTGALIINARNFSSSPTETEFEIYLKDVNGTGTYQLNQSTHKFPDQVANYGYFIKRKVMPLNEWISDASHTGMVSITRLDTAAKVVSGNFSFTAASVDSSAVPVKVTEGRFDIKLQ